MRSILVLFILVFSSSVLAIPCDCEVQVYPPLTGPTDLEVNRLKTYELEEFSTYSVKNQLACRKSCLEAFHQDMSSDRLTALLMTYSERLIENKLLGYNCTGLTTLKYPVRVRALLGQMGLGNVSDTIQVINLEQRCF